jgi:hypothetical protein
MLKKLSQGLRHTYPGKWALYMIAATVAITLGGPSQVFAQDSEMLRDSLRMLNARFVTLDAERAAVASEIASLERRLAASKVDSIKASGGFVVTLFNPVRASAIIGDGNSVGGTIHLPPGQYVVEGARPPFVRLVGSTSGWVLPSKLPNTQSRLYAETLVRASPQSTPTTRPARESSARDNTPPRTVRPVPTRRSVAVQCSGTTQSGRRCRRRTTSSNGRCYQHGG